MYVFSLDFSHELGGSLKAAGLGDGSFVRVPDRRQAALDAATRSGDPVRLNKYPAIAGTTAARV